MLGKEDTDRREDGQSSSANLWSINDLVFWLCHQACLPFLYQRKAVAMNDTNCLLNYKIIHEMICACCLASCASQIIISEFDSLLWELPLH